MTITGPATRTAPSRAPGASGRGAGCSALSADAGEPMAGSAPAFRRLVAVEHVGSWPRKVADHSDTDVAALFERLRGQDVGLLLIRRTGRAGRSSDGARTVFVADLAPGASRVVRTEVHSTDDLAGIDADDTVFDSPAAEPVTDPVMLLCAHGRRDVCCAVHGRALAAELEAADADVWECTHLGGHRFAPTGLVLPTGYTYGRLDTAAALSAMKAAAGGEVDPWCCRGHAGLEPAQQVAELAVREATGIRDAGALLVDAVDGPGAVTVHAREHDRRWSVDVRADTGVAARPPSCGAALEPVTPLVAAGVREIG
ncbi:sucrase ferredoxin [Pseudonocardia phyllosphaerae]|uniref:sucrase ferredoxin n=1 Tax=Pseudonocardia phyllosphaerae TaxID=3390502 RepID=UPI0039783E17